MSIQIKKKFIKSQVIDGTKVLFLNEDSFKALNSSGSEVELFKVNLNDEFQFLQMPKISSNPVSNDDISRKGYVDSEISAEVSAREAEDLTFLKLDGSRSMEGDLNMEKVSGSGSGIISSYDVIAGGMAGLYTVTVVLNDPTNIFQYGGDFFQGDATSVNTSLPPWGAISVGLNYTVGVGTGIFYLVPKQSDGVTSNFAAAIKAGTLDFTLTDNSAFTPEGGLSGTVKYKIIGLANGSTQYEAINKGQLDAEESRAIGVETQLQTDLNNEIDARVADVDAEELRATTAEATLESEITATQTGAGLALDGAYVIDGFTNYIMAATSLANADSLLDAAVKIVSDNLAQEIVDRVADVDVEEAARIAADAALQSAIDSLGTGVQDELDDTQVGAGLQPDGSYVVPLVSNYLSTAVSLKDADSKLDTQIKVVADGLAQEILDRVADVNDEETRALAAESALDARLDIIEGADTVEGSVAKAEKDAKDYTDAQIAALVDSAPAVLDTLNELAAALGDDPNFATTIAGQIGNIQSELDSTQSGAGLGTDGTYSAPTVSNYLSSSISLKDADSKLDTQVKVVADGLAQEILDRVADVDAEESRALAAESVISGNLAQEILDRIADVDAEETRALAAESVISGNVAQEILDRIADVDAEESRALAAEGLLDGRLDILEGLDTVEGSVAKAEKDAKDYADGLIAQEVIDRNSAISTAVSNLVDGAPALLDTLNELAAAINDDENFAVTVAGQISGLDTRVDALEVASVEFKPTEQFIYSGSNTITLSYLAIPNSLRVSVDRLAVHQGYDYTVGVSGGFTTITFIGSLVTPGQEQLATGDEIYVEGAKVAIV